MEEGRADAVPLQPSVAPTALPPLAALLVAAAVHRPHAAARFGRGRHRRRGRCMAGGGKVVLLLLVLVRVVVVQ